MFGNIFNQKKKDDPANPNAGQPGSTDPNQQNANGQPTGNGPFDQSQAGQPGQATSPYQQTPGAVAQGQDPNAPMSADGSQPVQPGQVPSDQQQPGQPVQTDPNAPQTPGTPGQPNQQPGQPGQPTQPGQGQPNQPGATPGTPGQPGQPNQQAGQPGQPGQPGQTDPNAAKSAALRQDMSALTHLDPRATQVLTRAQEETRRIKQQYIEPEQVLYALLFDEQLYKLLGEFQVDGGQLSKEIQAKEKVGTFRGQPTLGKSAQQIFDQAYRDAKMRGANFISPEDLFVILFSPNYPTAALLQSKGLKKDMVVEKIAKNPNLNYSRKTVLEKYAIDLTEEARNGKLDPVAGRDKEIERIVHIMLRRTKNNPIIIGETGVGKTAIVEGLAQKIVAAQVPKDLLEKRIFQLDLASLVAGASHRGEFEERLKQVLNEVLNSNNRIVLFIDEIHALMGAGEGEGMNAANLIKPYLARGQMQIIGATTTIEYRKHFEKDKAFERRFQPVTAEEPSEENAFEMMKVLRPKYEKFHHVKIPDDALKESIKLARKYIGERYLPDKAIDLLDEACARVKLQGDAGQRGDSDVKKSDIEKVVSGWTGIPITKLTEDESEKLLKLEDRIHKRLVDQVEAVVSVSEAVRRGRIGLASGQRPIASFIFLGPTGVGKTELAKTLAELLFGRDDAMARLDMSEFMEKHEVAKLIGAPPGYVGYEEGGVLTEAVRKKPYSIVLLDEIEKAHPDVFNILLQLLEDGRLTDNKGNVISFKNTIVICTSNIGSALIQQVLSQQGTDKPTQEQLAKQFKDLQKLIKDELIKFLRPEVLNRFDEVVIFKPLQMEHMAGIVRLEIAKTAKLLKEQGFGLQITEKAIAKLAKDGYDPVYGARPLRRLIQTAIENPIALAIISKKFATGDTIVIDYNDSKNEFTFNKGGQAVAATPLTDEQFKVLLQKIANPDAIPDDNEKRNFLTLHEKVLQVSAAGNKLYTSILSVTAATPDLEIKSIRQQLEVAKDKDEIAKEILALAETMAQRLEVTKREKKILLQILKPEAATSEKEKARFKELHDKIVVESQNNNPLATKILQLTETTPDSTVDQLLVELQKAKDNEDELATEVLSALNNTITEEAEKEADAQPTTKFKKIIKQVINPLYAASPENKAKFSLLYDKISNAGQQNHPIAQSILSITDISSDADIDQLEKQLEKAKSEGDPLATEILATIEDAVKHDEVMKVKTPLLLIANPMSAKHMTERQTFTDLHDTLSQASQKGNELAGKLLNVAEATTDEEITKLKEELDKAKEQKDETALLILAAIDSYEPNTNTDEESDVVPPPAQQADGTQPQPGAEAVAVGPDGQPLPPVAGPGQPMPDGTMGQEQPQDMMQQPGQGPAVLPPTNGAAQMIPGQAPMQQQQPFGMTQPVAQNPMGPVQQGPMPVNQNPAYPPAPPTTGMQMNMPNQPMYQQPVQNAGQQVVEPMGSGPIMQPPFQNQPYNQGVNNQNFGSPMGMASAANLKEDDQS